MKYKKNGMYGLIHIESHSGSKSRGFTEMYYHELGKSTVFPPIYDKIFSYYDQSFFNIQKNDKFGFIFEEKSDCADSFYVNNTEIKYDTLPWGMPSHIYRTSTVGIRENQKYGLLKFNKDSCKIIYQIPCECKTKVQQLFIPFSDSSYTFVCKETEAHTMIIYDEENKQRFELPIIKKEGGIFYLLNTKSGNRYIVIEYQNTTENGKINQLAMYEDIYIIDVKNEKMKISFLGNENVSYENYTLHSMPLIMRKTKTDNGFNFDFFDIETEQILFSIPPSKKGCYLYFEKDYNCNNLRLMCLKKNIGCYDYETKTYTKGKCKKCE